VFTARYGLYIPPGLTFTNSAFCPHSVFMCFVWISEQTAIISIYSINRLVSITETQRVYGAVRTQSLNITGYNFIFKKGRAMAQADPTLPRSATGHYFGSSTGFVLLTLWWRAAWRLKVGVSVGHWWNGADREQPRYWEKTLSQCHFLHHKSHMDWLGIEPWPLRCEAGD
jgi:hypothetical protein